MKNLKKILSSVLALALCASMLPSAFAEGETTEAATAQPEVLVYRDYEDIPVTATRYQLARELMFNQTGNYGTTKLGTNDGVGVDPVLVNGADGQGIGVNTKSTDGSTAGAFANVTTSGYSTGKIYIAFDMQRKSDAELDEQDGTTDGYKTVTNEETGEESKTYVTHDTYFYMNGGDGSTQQYGRIYTRHTNSKAAPWSGTNPGIYTPDENVHRYEYIVDLDNDTFKGYVDGAQVGNGTTYAADFVKFSMTLTNAIKYLDNFTIVHYPTDCANTFAVTAKGIDYKNELLVVDFDSNAKTVTDTATYTANYPIYVTSEVTPASFAVTNKEGEAVAVSSVTPAGAFGSYKIALEGGLVTGETYTVSAVSGLTDVCGATVDTAATATFNPVAPTVLYFRDYENYASGNGVFGNTYGTGASMGNNDPLNNSSVAVTGVDGVAVDPGAGSGAPPLTLTTPITSGSVYIGVDLEPYTAEEYEAGIGTKDDMWFVVKSSDNNTGRYVRIGAGCTPQNWEDIAKFGQLPDGYHRLEVVINLDENRVYSYLDGVAKGTPLAYARSNFNSLSFYITSNGLKKWDNVTVVHYPTGAVNMFSLAAKSSSYANNALTVDFDNDAQTTVDTTTYKANYPTILTRELTVEDFTVTNSNGEAVAVAAVNKNAAFGSYDLVLEETLAEGETYTVSVVDDLESTLGGTINGTSADIKTTAPEVLIFRDYENYISGGDIYNATGAYGSWKVSAATGFATGITPEKAADGVAITTPAVAGGNTTGSWRAMFPYVLKEGKFYLGYDIQKKSDEEFNAMDGETPKVHELLGYLLIGDTWVDSNQRYLRNSVSHSSITSGIGNWNIPIAQYYVGSGYNRIEYIVDLDADKIYLYVNGEEIASNNFAANLYGYAQEIENCVKYFDNFTMVHIPNGSLPQTFSLQDAKADKDANTISVKLKSDIKGAAYPIITEDLEVSDFTVLDSNGSALTITKVEKGTAFGEYVITVAESFEENATYSVVAGAEKSDVLGATLDTSAEATAYVTPDVYVDYGFDDYTGVGTAFNLPGVSGQKANYQKAVSDVKYGKGLDVILPETEAWPLTLLTKAFKTSVNEGKLVISYDWMFDEFPNQRQQLQLKTASGKNIGSWGNADMYLAYFDKAADGNVAVSTPATAGSWNNNEAKTLTPDTMYHFDFVFDYDNAKYEAFVNGELFGGYTINPVTMGAASASVYISTGVTFFDNLRIAYSEADSFGVTKTAWQGDYAEVLLSEGADSASLALAGSVVVTDNATGTAVAATVELSGRRVLIAGLDKTKSYTVTLPENYTSVTGNTLTEKTAVIEPGEFAIVNISITADENGAPVNKADLVAGDKVYAAVTYTNQSGKDYTFTLLGATYAEDRMTDTNFANITASGAVSTEVTEYVELDVTDVTELEIKAFAVESLVNLKPLGNSVVK